MNGRDKLFLKIREQMQKSTVYRRKFYDFFDLRLFLPLLLVHCAVNEQTPVHHQSLEGVRQAVPVVVEPPPESRMLQRPGVTLGKALSLSSDYKLPSAPPDKNLRVVALYFKAANDRFDASAPAYSQALRCQVGRWPLSSPAPLWQGELLIPTPFDPVTVHRDTAAFPASLTTYFFHLSGGKLWLYGDEIAYTGPPIARAANRKEWRQANKRIIQWFVEQHDTRPYDNDGDGVIDLLMLISRARSKFAYGREKGGHYQGVANGDFLPPGVRIADPRDPGKPVFRAHGSIRRNSGIYQTDCYALNSRPIIIHEIGHLLIGPGHFNGLQRWNLMSGAGRNAPKRSGTVFSAWEKMRLDWLRPMVVTHSQRNFILRDLTLHNEAVQIPLKGGSYFLLEYRRNRDRFEKTPQAFCPDEHLLREGLVISFARARGEPQLRAFFPLARLQKAAQSGRFLKLTPDTRPGTAGLRGRKTGIALTNIRLGEEGVVLDIEIPE